MSKFLLVATSNAVEGREAEYNEWYDKDHMPQLLAIPGVVSGRRFEASPVSPHQTPGQYMAIYEIETDDPASVLAELGQRSASGEMSRTDALDAASAQLWIWREL